LSSILSRNSTGQKDTIQSFGNKLKRLPNELGETIKRIYIWSLCCQGDTSLSPSKCLDGIPDSCMHMHAEEEDDPNQRLI
jgi:hypothetical protein